MGEMTSVDVTKENGNTILHCQVMFYEERKWGIKICPNDIFTQILQHSQSHSSFYFYFFRFNELRN